MFEKQERFIRALSIVFLVIIISALVVFYTLNSKKNQKFMVYTVQQGDTLSSISLSIKPQADWRNLSDKIRYYNKGLSPVLHEGQQIKIPVQ